MCYFLMNDVKKAEQYMKRAAQAKKEAFEAVGVRVGKTPSETAALMREVYASL